MNAMDQTTMLELKEVMGARRIEYDLTGVYLVLSTGNVYIPHRAIQCMARLVRSAEEEAIDALRSQQEGQLTEGWPS